MEEATITLYKVGSCGFYDEEGNHLFASLAETMRHLATWVATLGSIGESSTYPADEDADVLRAFCLDAKDLGAGRYLVATWNELASIEEGVQVLQMTSRIGAPDISAVEIDALALPGYPAFFCVDTRRKRVINIRFDQRLNGSRQFQRFISGYLSSVSPWCVWDADDENSLLGYSNEDGKNPKIVDGAVAEFSTNLARVVAEEGIIRDRYDEVRKIVRRTTISPVIEEQKSFLDLAFKFTGMPVNNRLRADIGFQYEFKMRLTLEKMNGIIEQYHENRDDVWDDVGFVFAKEAQKIHWLSGSIAREKLQMNVDRDENGMINVSVLADYMKENFDRILGLFNE